MNRESLEALLVDRALGELPPETAELLDAFLAQSADAAAQAASWRETVMHARAALAAPTGTVNPPSPIAPWLRREAVRNRWRQRVGEISRLAACALLGVGLGWSWFSPGRSVPAPFASIETRTSDTAAPRFWSWETYLDRREDRTVTPVAPNGHPQWPWTSPVKKPRREAGT